VIIKRLGHLSNGGIARLSLAGNVGGRAGKPTGYVVTASRDKGDGVRLIAWKIKGSSLERRGDVIDPGNLFVHNVAIAEAGFTQNDPIFIVATEKIGGPPDLKLWRLSSDGSLSCVGVMNLAVRMVAEGFLPTRKVSVIGLPPDKFVVAGRSDAGRLRISAWKTDGLWPLGVQHSGPMNAITLAKWTEAKTITKGVYHVVSAVRLASGRMRLIDWRVEDSGSLTRLGHITAGPVSELLTEGRFGTAVITGGQLKLISWRVDGAGSWERLQPDHLAGDELKGLSFQGDEPSFFKYLGGRTPDNKLKAIVWYWTLVPKIARLFSPQIV
jgi:hypothetical protein